MYLLDTNICIAVMKEEQIAFKRLPELESEGIRIPSVVYAELSFGAWKSRDVADSLEKLAAFMKIFQVVPFDEAASRQYGRLRAFLEKAGTPIGPNDLIIAATALALNATLVTRNVREFSRVPELRWITF